MIRISLRLQQSQILFAYAHIYITDANSIRRECEKAFNHTDLISRAVSQTGRFLCSWYVFYTCCFLDANLCCIIDMILNLGLFHYS